MADWQTSLIDEPTVTGPGQPDGHFRLIAAINELRAAVDEIVADDGSGEPIVIGDVEGLTDALANLSESLDGKADTGDIPDVSGFATTAALNALTARVEALEAPDED